MLQQGYGKECMSRTQCYEWFNRFKLGRTTIKDNEKSGRPSTSTDDDHVQKVHDVIRKNRRLTVREVSEEVGICKSSCHLILTEKLNMHRVAAKFVPRLLTEEQKEKRVIVSRELLDRSNDDENFLKNVITGGETWVYDYDIETKVQSSPRPKKARQSRSNIKIMLIVFFDWKGIVHQEFVPRGQTVNKEFYLTVMQRLREAVRKKRSEAWVSNSWMLHHDNAPAQASFLINEFLAKHATTVVPQPPYSPDLAPADFFLFKKLKSILKGRRFQTIKEIKENLLQDLHTIPETEFQEAFQQWKKHWEWCINNAGEYFEGD